MSVPSESIRSRTPQEVRGTADHDGCVFGFPPQWRETPNFNRGVRLRIFGSGGVFSLQRPSKPSQAILHTDDVSGCRRSEVATTTSNDDCQYVKLDEKTLPDGTKMKFYAHKDGGPTFDEVMEDIYELASEALIRKLSK